MFRAFQSPSDRTPFPSFECSKVRVEVIGMINKSLSCPQLRTADATIIAVLQLLHSEIISGNEETMAVHQAGLRAMVQQRGGLHKLGVNGFLAGNLAT